MEDIYLLPFSGFQLQFNHIHLSYPHRSFKQAIGVVTN